MKFTVRHAASHLPTLRRNVKEVVWYVLFVILLRRNDRRMFVP